MRIATTDGIGLSKEWKKGVVADVLPNRSYKVQSDGQHNRRNRRHLKLSKHQQQLEIDGAVQEEGGKLIGQEEPTIPYFPRSGREVKEQEIVDQEEPTLPYITRSGREVKEPSRFKDYVKYQSLSKSSNITTVDHYMFFMYLHVI